MTVAQSIFNAMAPIEMPVILVFSHVRWNFVYKRPQHLLSRLAGRWRVMFVEEPVYAEGPARLDLRCECSYGGYGGQGGQGGDEVEVLIPHTPIDAPGFHDDQLSAVQGLIDAFLKARGLRVDVAWLYTPMALPLAKTVQPACVVYDCMDELAAFGHAPRQMRQRESAAMKEASFVLTGGPSLYESRRHLHPKVIFLPSAVDSAHYAPANLALGSEQDMQAQALQGALPQPRLGFFGVIDERLDIELLAALADAHPEWSIVMAGPVVKIDPATLPQSPNIHWLGMQPYERLPYLLAGWDVALMPFALNESTRFISPTKTLEYMAGEKPVVSTPVRDVVVMYGEAVTVADGARAFVQACESLLAQAPAQECEHSITTLNMVSQHSWLRSADIVHTLMVRALNDARAALAVAADIETETETETEISRHLVAVGASVGRDASALAAC